MHTDLLRIVHAAPGSGTKEKAHSAVCRTGFFGIVTQFPIWFDLGAKLFRGERIRKISIPITRRSIGDC